MIALTPGPDGPPERPTLLHAFHYTAGITSVLELHGECDCTTQATLREILEQALGSQPEALVIDLEQLTFCDAGCSRDLLAVARLHDVDVRGAHGVTALILNLLDSQLGDGAGRGPRDQDGPEHQRGPGTAGHREAPGRPWLVQPPGDSDEWN